MLYLITYDLLVPGQDYDTLIKTLVSWGAKRVALSTWVIRSKHGAKALGNALPSYMDTNDRLIVTQMGADWATWNAMFDINKI